MKPQLPHCQRNADDIDVDALTLDELRAYNAGLRERLTSLITRKCGRAQCGQCGQCKHLLLCGRHSPGD